MLKRVAIALLWLGLFGVVGLVASVGLLFATAGGLPQPADRGWQFALQSACLTAGFLFATWLVGVRLAGHSWAELGWRRDGFLRRLTAGVLGGAAIAVLAVTIAVLGGARVGLESAVGYLTAAAWLAAGLLAAALFEELTFRGFPLRRVSTALGPAAATGLFAVAFGVAHLDNPSATLFGTVNIAFAAVWLAVAFFSAGGMALAWGLHFGWNATLALGFDAPVSGIDFGVPAFEYVSGRWSWLDGGPFGPEGGLVATIAIIAGTAYLLRGRLRRPATWLGP